MAAIKSTTKTGTKNDAGAAASAKEVKARENEGKEPANVAAVTSSEGFSPSGAPRQPGNFDPAHPAIDNNPRANTSVDQNRVDMNDPSLSMEAAVAENLKKDGSGAVAGDDDETEQKD